MATATQIVSGSDSSGERFAGSAGKLTGSLPEILASPVNLGPPGLPFAEVVATEAAYYRSWGTSVGYWLARYLDDAVQLIRYTKATNPADYGDRIDALDRFRDERLRQERGGPC